MTIISGFSRYILTIVPLLCMASLHAQNLVPNGSFSNIGANWTFFAPANGTEAYLAETSYGGSMGTNIVAEVDMECNLRQTGLAVVPGVTYWFSFRRTRRTAGGAPLPTTIKVKLYDGAVSYIDQNISSNNTSWDWQCETFQFTPTGNTVSIDFSNIAASTLGTMIDDVTITPVLQPITLVGTACQGGYVELAAPSFPADPNAVYSNYNWTGPNGFAAIGPVIVFSNAQASLNGPYICTMSLNGCLTVTGTYNLTVAPSTFPISVDLCEGSVYNFYGKTLYTSGLYDTLIKSNNNTCDSLILLQLNVHPIPDVNTIPTGAVAICTGDTLTLQLPNSTINNSHQWMKDGQLMNGETSDRYKAFTSGVYKVAVRSDKGCTDTSAPINLTVHQPPTAQIDPDLPQAVCINDTLNFSARNSAFYYRWSPEAMFRRTTGNDGQTVSGIISGTTSDVVLTVYNEVGCYASDTLTIHAEPCCPIFVPNAFSPNGDGHNEYFQPVLRPGQLIVAFQIFDRWGSVVYTNSGSSSGWDGRYASGATADGGVYHYLIQYTCNGGPNERYRGEVSLVR